MVKSWEEVEGSDQYKDLDDSSKTQARKQYFTEFVESNEEFQNLEPEQQSEARGQFFGEEQTVEVPTTFDNVMKATALGMNRAGERLKERGKLDFTDSLAKLGDKATRLEGVIEIAVDPFKRIEAALANPILSAQKGDWLGIPKALIDGLSGQKVGEFGDVYVAAGVPEDIANGLGLATDMVLGGAVFEQGMKALQKGLLKGIDKIGLKGVESLLKGVDRAGKASKQITNKFWEPIKNIKVDADDFAEVAAKFPKSFVDDVKELTGISVDDIIDSGTLGDLRILKEKLAILKAGSFEGMATLGKQKMQKLYSEVSSVIDTTLKKAGKADMIPELDNVNKAATSMIKAEGIVTSTLKTGKGKIKVEEAMEQYKNFKGSDFKRRLNMLKKTGKEAKKLIDEGTLTMKKLLRKQALHGIAKGTGRAALFGGVAGSIGAGTAKHVYGK